MLIDEFLPHYEFAEVHSIQVASPSQQVLRAAKQITPQETPRFGVLMRLRALPARLAGHERLELAAHRPIFDQMLDAGFQLLAEEADREVVVGAIAQPWRLFASSRPPVVRPEEFRVWTCAGYAKLAMNFHVAPRGQESLLRTETRVALSDAKTRRKFAAYWALIRPWSSLVRREWLAAVKRRAAAAV